MRTHAIIESQDSKGFTFWDLTTDQEYIDMGVDIPTDVFQFVIIMDTYANPTPSPIEIDITSTWLDSRTPNGLKISAEEFGLSRFPDKVYTIQSVLREIPDGSTEHVAQTDQPFYAEVKNEVMRKAISAGWKKSLGPGNIYVRNEIRMQNWLTNLEYAEELNMPVEAERILNALLKITGLWIKTN